MALRPSPRFRPRPARRLNIHNMLIVSISRTLCSAVLAVAILLPHPADAFWPFTKSNEERFQEACEVVLLDRLKSPSSYRFVSLTEVRVKPATKAEFYGWQTTQEEFEYFAKVRRDTRLAKMHKWQEELFALKPNIVLAYLEYDAANSYGTLIRGVVECSMITRNDAYEPSPRDEKIMRVDGKSQFSWALSH